MLTAQRERKHDVLALLGIVRIANGVECPATPQAQPCVRADNPLRGSPLNFVRWGVGRNLQRGGVTCQAATNTSLRSKEMLVYQK